MGAVRAASASVTAHRARTLVCVDVGVITAADVASRLDRGLLLVLPEAEQQRQGAESRPDAEKTSAALLFLARRHRAGTPAIPRTVVVSPGVGRAAAVVLLLDDGLRLLLLLAAETNNGHDAMP